jgi:Cu+-exporting ATPase
MPVLYLYRYNMQPQNTPFCLLPDFGLLSGHTPKVYMVTGDNPQAAAAIAAQAGVASENIFAQVRPGQKADLVRQLQDEGEKVAFVGDGINDAPALEQADLGIAVSQASDIAGEAADIVLLKSGLEAVPEALELARATLATIRQNLFWAFFYNAAAVPLAALGFLSPILCAAAMGLSDLVVIGNALRLGRFATKQDIVFSPGIPTPTGSPHFATRSPPPST